MLKNVKFFTHYFFRPTLGFSPLRNDGANYAMRRGRLSENYSHIG